MPMFSQLRVTQLRATLRCAVLGVSSFVAMNGVAQQSEARPGSVPRADPPLRLTWESDDPACSGDDVSARAFQMVTPGVTARPLRATVQVRRETNQWLVRLQTESGDQSGQRILRAESCKEIQEAIALLLAMSMESKGDILPPASPAPAAVAPPGVPVPEPAPVAPPPDMRDERPATGVRASNLQLGWFLRLAGKAANGLKPGLGLGAGATAGVRVGSFDVGLGAAYWPESRKRAPNRAGFVDIERQNLALHVCWNAWRSGAVVLAPCLAPGVVRFNYRSTGLRSLEANLSRPLPSVTAGVDLRYELLAGRLSFLVNPGLTWERPQPFDIGLTDGPLPADGPPDNIVREKIYETSGLGPGLEIGVDARF